MSTSVVNIVSEALGGLGYQPRLRESEWKLADVTGVGSDSFAVPLMAFWGRPFDQFRTAIAVVNRNGLKDNELARETARACWSHVVICGDDDFSIWTLDQYDVNPLVEYSPIGGVVSLLEQHRARLEPANVAREKFRLRQYALYELDPSGQSFGEWATLPTAHQAGVALNKVFESAVALSKKSDADHIQSVSRDENAMRLIFRLLTLRIGFDRGWGISQGLGREDTRAYQERATQYPVSWASDTVHDGRIYESNLTETVLDSLRFFDFSTFDPALVAKAISSPILRSLRAALDLFPTPSRIAWEMMSDLPGGSDYRICDATSGTGTFLTAAGHSLWNAEGPQANVDELLRAVLIGGDQSPLSADLTRICLDLTFDWSTEGWNVRNAPAEETLKGLDRRHTWALVGNLPWSGAGRSENMAAHVLLEYLRFLAEQESGWTATIVPKSIWTNRGKAGRELRSLVARDFKFQQIWEFGWGAILGGRSQAIASVVARGAADDSITSGVVIWKREDTVGDIQTIGYTRPWKQSTTPPVFESPEAILFKNRLANHTTLDTFFDIRVGLQPKQVSRLLEFAGETSDSIPFILSPSQLLSDISNSDWTYRISDSDIDNDRWISNNFSRPQYAYRAQRKNLSQIFISQTMYEGVHRSIVGMINQPSMLSNRFFICIPKSGVSNSRVAATAVALNSVFGRIWLNSFASAGRHLAKSDIERFPLVEADDFSQLAGLVRLQENSDPLVLLPFSAPELFDSQVEICQAYGLDTDEIAAILGIGFFMGLNTPISNDFNGKIGDSVTDPAIVPSELSQLFQKPTSEMTPEEISRALKLWDDVLVGTDRKYYYIARFADGEISLKKSAVSES